MKTNGTDPAGDRFSDDELSELLIRVLALVRDVPADDPALVRDVAAAVARRRRLERGDAGHDA